MRRLSGAVCGLFWLAAACPALAAEALHIVAPPELRALLQRHLSVPPAGQADVATAADGAAGTDDAAREAYARRLRKDAGALLATAGYFSPQFYVRYDGDEPVLDVTPGVRATIGKVAIELRGALDEARRAQLRAGWTLPVGAAFTQAAWDEAKQAVLRELSSADYARARLTSSLAEVDVEGARVDLTLVYDAGPRVRYGALSIDGLQRYQRALVERYTAALRAGAPYHQDELLAVQSALQNTPYFSSVSVELGAPADPAGGTDGVEAGEGGGEHAAPGAAPDAVELPVIITLRERQPFRVALGAGVSSNTGVRVEASFSNADLFNRAWELSSGVRIEQLRQIAYADVFLPPDERKRRDSFGAVVEKSDIEGLAIERAALALARTERRASIEQRLGLNWQYEQQRPDGGETSINRALTATAGWVWRHADDPRDASEGIVAQLQLGASAKALLSDQNFLRSYLRYSQGIPLGRKDSVLLRGEVGYTAAPSRQGIPQDYLFRTGGSNSVRGYDYLSLGVQDGSATVGGRYLLVVSGEYTRWIDAHWGVATFVDAGQAADDRDVFSLALGYGVGARWKSPAGPLAVDLAWGQRNRALHLHFSLAVPF